MSRPELAVLKASTALLVRSARSCEPHQNTRSCLVSCPQEEPPITAEAANPAPTPRIVRRSTRWSLINSLLFPGRIRACTILFYFYRSLSPYLLASRDLLTKSLSLRY